MRRAVVAITIAACGRIGFDGLTTGSGSAGDAPTIDTVTTACVAGDNVCRVSCLGSDSDCTTTCGDGRCVGNAGEFCTNCAADCMTLSPVCGNGACDPGEDSDICYADCGPTPWTAAWVVEEGQLVSMINAARTGGTTCPGSGAATVPSLAASGSGTAQAREMAWERSYQGFTGSGNTVACNGRTLGQRVGLPSAAWIAFGPDASSAVGFWLGDATVCPSIMKATWVELGAGVSHDAMAGYYVIVLR
jgi:hypothetical protein